MARIRITNGAASVGYDLAVVDFMHFMKRETLVNVLHSVRTPEGAIENQRNFLDIGSIKEQIIIRGLTDEINGPTKEQLEEAFRTWGHNVNPNLDEPPYPRVYETPDAYYTGQFGRFAFTHSAGMRGAFDFMLEFKVGEKVAAVVGENFWLHVESAGCGGVEVNGVPVTEFPYYEEHAKGTTVDLEATEFYSEGPNVGSETRDWDVTAPRSLYARGLTTDDASLFSFGMLWNDVPDSEAFIMKHDGWDLSLEASRWYARAGSAGWWNDIEDVHCDGGNLYFAGWTLGTLGKDNAWIGRCDGTSLVQNLGCQWDEGPLYTTYGTKVLVHGGRVYFGGTNSDDNNWFFLFELGMDLGFVDCLMINAKNSSSGAYLGSLIADADDDTVWLIAEGDISEGWQAQNPGVIYHFRGATVLDRAAYYRDGFPTASCGFSNGVDGGDGYLYCTNSLGLNKIRKSDLSVAANTLAAGTAGGSRICGVATSDEYVYTASTYHQGFGIYYIIIERFDKATLTRDRCHYFKEQDAGGDVLRAAAGGNSLVFLGGYLYSSGNVTRGTWQCPVLTKFDADLSGDGNCGTPGYIEREMSPPVEGRVDILSKACTTAMTPHVPLAWNNYERDGAITGLTERALCEIGTWQGGPACAFDHWEGDVGDPNDEETSVLMDEDQRVVLHSG